MTTSRDITAPRHAGQTFAEMARAVAWSAWVRLGVSGWPGPEPDWAIDPEPLIIFTAFLGDEDPRLRDEATDWCIRNLPYVSKTRLRNLVRSQPLRVRDAFGEFAATVGEHAGVTWPAATVPRPFTVTGRSGPPLLDQPAMVWLRLRAMFGVGARAEILRYFLARASSHASVATIAGGTSYTKRNVADECEGLARAGVLAYRKLGNRFYFSLARRPELEAFVGTLPEIRPDWVAMFNVARDLILLEGEAATSTSRTLAVKVRKSLDQIAPEFDALGIEPLRSDVLGEDLWPAVRQLGFETLGEWSFGRWHRPPDKT